MYDGGGGGRGREGGRVLLYTCICINVYTH